MYNDSTFSCSLPVVIVDDPMITLTIRTLPLRKTWIKVRNQEGVEGWIRSEHVQMYY